MINVLHLDSNHPVLVEGLEKMGVQNDFDYHSTKEQIAQIIAKYQGVIVRSRIPIDKTLIDAGTKLSFIARVGSGLENIDTTYAKSKNIRVLSSPEGNRNAVSEHALGMILSLFNHLNRCEKEIQQGLWLREQNRGEELKGKTIGLIGYGNTGQQFAQKLSGFEVKVLCFDILKGKGDSYAQQVPMEELYKKADIISLHIPENPSTFGIIDEKFILRMQKPFWLINTSRGNHVITSDLVKALRKGKIKGGCLDVLEYEKNTFEHLFDRQDFPIDLQYLIQANNVILSPHIAGWSHQSKIDLAQIILEKIKSLYKKV